MRGCVARNGDRWYAVVYEGLDPVTGKERRSWHPAGPDREKAEVLAARLAADMNGRDDEVRTLSFGAYLTGQWLPGKKINLAESTWDGYRRKIDRHIHPAIGHVRIRRLRSHHLEGLYDRMLHPTDDHRALCAEDGAGGSSHHQRRRPRCGEAGSGQPERGPGSPRSKAPCHSQGGAAGVDRRAITDISAGCGRPSALFQAFWVLAATGMQRSELLGLRWGDLDFKRARVSVNRGLFAVAYELRESRGKTPNSRRAIDLDPTTIKVLRAWRDWQEAEQEAAGIESAGCSLAPTANPSTHIRSPRPSNASPPGQECHGSASTI